MSGQKESEMHCDDWVDKGIGPPCLTAFLEYHRQPAAWKVQPIPDWYREVADFPEGWPKADPGPLWAAHQGKWVRIVMVSRFGDVGVTDNLDAENGYRLRVYLPELSQFTVERPSRHAPPTRETA